MWIRLQHLEIGDIERYTRCPVTVVYTSVGGSVTIYKQHKWRHYNSLFIVAMILLESMNLAIVMLHLTQVAIGRICVNTVCIPLSRHINSDSGRGLVVKNVVTDSKKHKLLLQ